MAFVINDRVKETTTTTGTGTFTLGGAVTGFETFGTGVGNSNTTYYAVTLPGSTEFEVGLGTLSSDSSTIARTTIISSSNSDSAVNFSAGTKTIFCTIPASKSVLLSDVGASTLNLSSADTHAGRYGSSSSPIIIKVTVASKSAHPYQGDGSGNAYYLNGIEAPALTFHGVDNTTSDSGYYYRFDQSDSSNSGHPLRFYLDADKTTSYTTGVTTNGTAGSSGAYTQIDVDEDTPNILYYQCSSHAYMGNYGITLGSNKINHTEALISFPTTTGTLVGTGDTGSVTNDMLAGSIADSKLSTISTAGKVELGALEIDGASDVGEDLVDADLIIVDNGANGTEVKSTLTRVKKYIYSAMSGDATASDSGALTIANTSVETAMIAADAVTGDKIADDAINSEHYTDGSIDTAHIADAQVTLAKIADQVANTVLVRDANSAGVVSAKAVTDTQILIGDGTGFTAAALSGDVTMTNAGAVTIANGAVENAMLADDAVGADELAANAVVNASIASGAAIEFSKMENLTASRALVSDTNGDVSVSAVTSTEIGYLDGVTSAVQTQIDAKAGKGFAVAMAIAL
tara:strand:+ start:267 stop:1988 length:1722 start_codon:yes stop_codon:yes gene_type:complete